MRRALFKNVSHVAKSYISSPHKPTPFHQNTLFVKPYFNPYNTRTRFFTCESGPSDQNPNTCDGSSSEIKDSGFVVADVTNEELQSRIDKYFKGDEEALPSIREAILSRRLSGKHKATDDRIIEQMKFAPLDKVKDAQLEVDFEEAHDTDDDVPNLCDAKKIVIKRMVQDEYFNMDDKKWDGIVNEAKQKGYLMDTRECEEILEDMVYWDKLLPEDVKQKVQAKYDELGEKLESKKLDLEEAYEQFKVFEDEIVAKHIKKDEEEIPLESDNVPEPVYSKKTDDPPGEGPILRWQTRLVVFPGGHAWHPKNRKVKLLVTVKELGLSKHQFRRLREIVGKRYHPGKDELTITSERFEHREENRKDCLRTLLGIIEEAGKADALADEARTAYVKQRLKANPEFMERLHAKKQQDPTIIPS